MYGVSCDYQYYHCRRFTSNVAAQCLYFFKSCYFIASSFQIVAGYPARILGYLLTSSYNVVACEYLTLTKRRKEKFEVISYKSITITSSNV